ncbi:PocR ligand-binding domain-containing protein [Gorillibacterium massiliense]|uniref:PocR ligand-binding domain-containing protein n=1 Tax=Gorillibacterium massiliense TaxID=1280390 RepID=UPI0004AF7A4A|nr:PocR ligand-binding domain-containing protein [Gorillibacterium massiliense]
MIREHLGLRHILDLEKWEQLQDSLAAVTKLAILTVDYKGNPVTAHSGCQSFCQMVRQDEHLLPYCKKCDSRGGIEAARTNEPYIYLCHYNIIDIAIPIIIDDQYLGAVMAGQIRLSDSTNDAELEQISSTKNKKLYSEKWDDLKDHYANLPTMSYSEVQTVSKMLFQLCSYLVQEALNKNQLIEALKESTAVGSALSLSAISDILSSDSLHHAEASHKQKINPSAPDPDNPGCTSPVLQPAFDYVYAHKSENLSLKKAAELCHISPSYFSRLFVKETAENFSTYLPRLKMKWAIQLLAISDLPVSQISNELGYSETGYFIKVFKKYVGSTPAVYRRNNKG